MALIDTFSGAAATLHGRTSDTSGHVWTVQAGNFSTDGSGRASTTTTGSIATVNTAEPDGTVSAKLPVIGGASQGNAGVVFRFVDTANLFRFMADGSSGQLFLQRVVAGTNVNVWNGGAFAANDVLSVEMTGSTIKLYRNGVLQSTITDSNHLSAGLHGLWDQHSVWRLDDFNAPLPGSGAVLLRFDLSPDNVGATADFTRIRSTFNNTALPVCEAGPQAGNDGIFDWKPQTINITSLWVGTGSDVWAYQFASPSGSPYTYAAHVRNVRVETGLGVFIEGDQFYPLLYGQEVTAAGYDNGTSVHSPLAVPVCGGSLVLQAGAFVNHYFPGVRCAAAWTVGRIGW